MAAFILGLCLTSSPANKTLTHHQRIQTQKTFCHDHHAARNIPGQGKKLDADIFVGYISDIKLQSKAWPRFLYFVSFTTSRNTKSNKRDLQSSLAGGCFLY